MIQNCKGEEPSQAIFLITPNQRRQISLEELGKKLNVHYTVNNGYIQLRLNGIVYRISRHLSIYVFINFRKLYSQETIYRRFVNLLRCLLNVHKFKRVKFSSRVINVQGSFSHTYVNFEKLGRKLVQNPSFVLDRSSVESESFRSKKFVVNDIGTISIYRTKISIVTRDFTKYNNLIDILRKEIIPK